MDEEIKKLLDEEIAAEIRKVSTFDTGSDAKSAAIDDLAKLHKLRIEELKNRADKPVKECYLKLGVEVAGIVLPLIFYAVWMKRGFLFEETGTFTSTTFKSLFNRFRPTKN